MADTTNNRNNGAARIMLIFTLLFTVVSIFLLWRIIDIKFFWEPDRRTLGMDDFKLQADKNTLKPQRGQILDCNGRLLAITIPKYDIELDCGVRKAYFAGLKGNDEKSGRPLSEVSEEKWQRDAREFAKGMTALLGDRLARRDLETEIFRRRNSSSTQSKTITIAKGVDYITMEEIRRLPLANVQPHIGGVKVKTRYERGYPYDKLARSCIGYVRTNEEGSRARGIEGSFNHELHGVEGIEWRRIVDDRNWVKDTDSTSVPAKDGKDVKLTLDIDIQDIADKALRKEVEEDANIEDACMIVMEVKTGAVKAMVNLHRGSDGKAEETLNIALTRASEPGSVFKTVALMTLLEDGKVRLDTRIPTNHGKLPPFKDDRHMVEYERDHKRSTISVIEGLEMSSNYVFAYLAMEHYAKCPKDFTSRCYDYGFGVNWNFDIKGMAKGSIPDPDSKDWSLTDLGAMAYGYASSITPMHTLAFYNSIANKGNLVKPRIVEGIYSNGRCETEFQTVSLNKSVCRKATADTLTRALRAVVTDGTGKKMNAAKCHVAGKTGTARIALSAEESKGSRDRYTSKDGKKKNQGSFVGFFPAEDPVYSAIVVMYSGLSSTSYYGGDRPAKTFRKVADALYSMNPEWRETIKEEKPMPEMHTRKEVADKRGPEITPDVKGLGLNEALYLIENSGYHCSFSGTGHVTKQTPAAGSRLAKGKTVNIELN